MKKVFLWTLVAALGTAAGCIKSSSDVAIKADGSFSVKLSVSYLTSTYEKMKSAPLDCTCWRFYQIHKDSIPVARRALDAFEAGFDDKKVGAQWARLGLQVGRSSLTERDGFRVLEIEATGSSISDFNAKLAAALKAAGPDEYLTALPWFLHTRRIIPRVPRFMKTADPEVVKAVIPVGDVGDELAGLADLTEDAKGKLSSQLSYMRMMKAFDEGAIKVRVKLPGTIVSVENGTKEGTDTVVLDLKGPEIEPQTISNQAKAKGKITATLKIDPKTFKIPLEG